MGHFRGRLFDGNAVATLRRRDCFTVGRSERRKIRLRCQIERLLAEGVLP